MKVPAVFILLSMLHSNGFSQAGTQWELSISPQIARLSVIDKEFSSLPFSAILPGCGLSLQHGGQYFTHMLSFSYLGGNLTTTTHPVYHQHQHYLNIDYTGWYKLGARDATWTGSVGAAIQLLYDERKYPELINHNNTYDFAASLGPAGSLTYSFNNIWSLSDQLSIPFIAWLAEPDDRRHIGSFSSFVRWNNAFSLHSNLSIHHRLSLTYHWDYYKITDLRDVRLASHRLELIYHLIF